MEFLFPKIDGLTFRPAQPSDAAAFAKWATNNDKIPKKDILAALSENNPTTVVIVVEKDGEPLLYVPLYCSINLAYLGFRPGSHGKDRLKAMAAMQWAIASFAFEHGIREVNVQTSKDYPVGQWALKHGFKEESRQTFKMRVTPLVDPSVVKEVPDVQ